MDAQFEAFRTERKTASGKAAVEVAKQLWHTGCVTEARLWLKLALETDKDNLSKRLDALEERFEAKEQGREIATRMRERAKAASGDNVVAFPGKDEI